MKKSRSSSTAKSRGMQTEPKKLTEMETETEMKAALQLIQFSGGKDANNQDNDTRSGSKLPIRDEDDHSLQQAGISKKNIKFRSIIDLYKEYNWTSPMGKNPNTNISAKEDSNIRTKILKYYPEVNSDGEMMDKMGCVNKRKFRSIADIYEATNPVGLNMN